MILLRDFAGLTVLATIFGCAAGVLVHDGDLPDQNTHDEEPADGNLKHRLEIFSMSPINGVTLVKRVNETLNLTCEVIRLETGPFFKWQLEWHLPQNMNNLSQRRLLIKTGFNTVQLLIGKLHETDSGRYRCAAHHDKSTSLQQTIEVRVLPRKGSCGDGMFLCSNSRCISQRYLCDGHKDCLGADDESRDVCGDSPCDGKLLCEDGRCISKHFCCDRYYDANCTAAYEIPCCTKLYLANDYTPIQTQKYNEIGFIQSTMYTIIGCAVAFIIILSFTIIAVCRVHVRRSALTNAYAAYRSDPRVWSDLDSYLTASSHSSARWTRGLLRSDLSRSPGLVLNSYGVHNADASASSTLLVTYNINNGVQLVGRPIEPPPYEELVPACAAAAAAAATREEPPPPYASRENLSPPTLAAEEAGVGVGRPAGGHHAPFLKALFSLLVSGSAAENRAADAAAAAAAASGSAAAADDNDDEEDEPDNNNGDINGNSTGQVWVQADGNAAGGSVARTLRAVRPPPPAVHAPPHAGARSRSAPVFSPAAAQQDDAAAAAAAADPDRNDVPE